MKEESNNEMDVLLRRLSRRGSSSVSDGVEASLDSEHLDADELNAYSENTLPPKTRLRYSGHLAECSQCRGIVAQLTQSAGIEVPQPVATTQPSWLAILLGKFLSPFKWRYVLPLLAAVGIVAIGLIVLRREPMRSFTAKTSQQVNEQPSAVVQSSQSPNAPIALSAKNQPPPSVENGRVAQTNSAPAADDKKLANLAGEKRNETTASEAPPKQPAEAAAAPVASAPATSDYSSRKVQVPDVQSKTEDLSRVKAEEDREQAQAAQKEPAAPQARRADEVKPMGSTENRAAGAYQTSPGVSSLSAARSKDTRRENKEDESKKETETRTVAGRQFRKQGNVWIDTAYSSSVRTLNVSRGSESYRALVADEPAIRTIAEELDGEIVVVWKGQAYRIR